MENIGFCTVIAQRQWEPEDLLRAQAALNTHKRGALAGAFQFPKTRLQDGLTELRPGASE